MLGGNDTPSPGSPGTSAPQPPGEQGRCTPAPWLLVARRACAERGLVQPLAPPRGSGRLLWLEAVPGDAPVWPLGLLFQPGHGVSLTVLIFHKHQLRFALFLYYFDRGLCQNVI